MNERAFYLTGEQLSALEGIHWDLSALKGRRPSNPDLLAALVSTAIWTGMRPAEIASMRADQIRRDSTGIYRATVRVKDRMPPALMPERVVRGTRYADWPLHPRLIAAYERMFARQGLRFLDFVDNAASDGLRWMPVEPETFGSDVPTDLVAAPLWLDNSTSGYLTRSEIYRYLRHALRTIGCATDNVHLLRSSSMRMWVYLLGFQPAELAATVRFAAWGSSAIAWAPPRLEHLRG